VAADKAPVVLALQYLVTRDTHPEERE